MINEKLDKQLIEVLKEKGFTESTELEQICIPRIKSGHDLMCIAPKGAGKTATIVVSVLHRLKASLNDVPRAVIVVPNKDIALEMKAEFERLGEYTDLRVNTACDNEKIDDQKDKVYMGSDVVIGTPKRLNLLYSLYALNLSAVKIFAIDNAESVIKSINYLQIDRLTESIPKAQKIVFAGELTEWLERYSNEFMNIQEVIEIEESDDKVEPSEE
ncbi:MAG: DEAD/DEAH box helicase [Prolixibacteraceae bacterium]|nr:DEAD/DEAH box helicase [Prolixibacteraceae bacterium]